MNPVKTQSGSTLPVHSIKTVVVYDEASGHIHHHHSVMTLLGGRESSDEEMAQDAMRALAQQQRAITPKLQVLHVAPGTLAPGKQYRVNHASRTLIAIE